MPLPLLATLLCCRRRSAAHRPCARLSLTKLRGGGPAPVTADTSPALTKHQNKTTIHVHSSRASDAHRSPGPNAFGGQMMRCGRPPSDILCHHSLCCITLIPLCSCWMAAVARQVVKQEGLVSRSYEAATQVVYAPASLDRPPAATVIQPCPSWPGHASLVWSHLIGLVTP